MTSIPPDTATAFQSTHPLRGATIVRPIADPVTHISIHAPLAGCDAKEATTGQEYKISIHAPLAGCDAALDAAGIDNPTISIHAPLAGCDSFASVSCL